jgi:hypothetical protein
LPVLAIGNRRSSGGSDFVGGIEKTGALSFLARRLLLPLGHSEILLTGSIMLLIGALSAFVNNTAAVAIFIPIVLEVCRRARVSPGRVLMPMSHAGDDWRNVYACRNFNQPRLARIRSHSGFAGILDV